MPSFNINRADRKHELRHLMFIFAIQYNKPTNNCVKNDPVVESTISWAATNNSFHYQLILWLFSFNCCVRKKREMPTTISSNPK